MNDSRKIDVTDDKISLTNRFNNKHQTEPPLYVSKGWIAGFWRTSSITETNNYISDMVGIDIPKENNWFVSPNSNFVYFRMEFENETVDAYGTKLCSPSTMMKKCISTATEGAVIVWIDQTLPMYRKDTLHQIGQIGLIEKGTSRFRIVCIFLRRPKPSSLSEVELIERPKEMNISVQQAIEGYNKVFPTRVTLGSTNNIFYGIWIIGNDYRNKSKFHGAYPAGLLARYDAVLNINDKNRILHLFAGSLPKSDLYTRFDIDPDRSDDLYGDACKLSSFFPSSSFDVIFADPPYSTYDAITFYGNTTLVNRASVIRECASVLSPGGWLVWLDTVSWYGIDIDNRLKIVGLVGLTRSTNHRFRLITFFQKS